MKITQEMLDEVTERPERISKMAQYLSDKEPLIYLFIINTDFIPDPKGVVLKNSFAGVTYYNRRVLFFYKPDWINEKLIPEQLYFLLIHEAFHILKKHHERHTKLKNFDLVNISEDAVINFEIKNASYEYDFKPKFINGGIEIPADFAYENRTMGKNTYETFRLYEWFLNKSNKVKAEDFLQPGSFCKNKKTGEYSKIISRNEKELNIMPVSEDEMLDEVIRKKPIENKESKKENTDNVMPVIFGDGINGIADRTKIPENFGEVEFRGSMDSILDSSGITDNESENGTPYVENEIERNLFIDKIMREAGEMEQKIVNKVAGVGAGGIFTRLKELNKPKINWRNEIRKKLNTFRSENSFIKDNKLSFINYPWNPRSNYGILGKYDIETTKNLQTYIIFAIDTSGSVFYSREEMETFFTEVESASKELEFSHLGHILTIQWDYEIQEGIKIYKRNSWKNFKISGGGGTDPRSVFRYINEIFVEKENGYLVKENETKFYIPNKKKLPLLVFLTDGIFYNKIKEDDLGVYKNNMKNVLWFTRDTNLIYPRENYIKYDI